VAWYEELPEKYHLDVDKVIAMLESAGVAPGHPQSSQLDGPLRELRIQSHGEPIRIAYAFDPRRQAVLLLGGNKKGDPDFYEWLIPKAKKIWKAYLAEQQAGEHDEE
jgi:hypothetical protein